MTFPLELRELDVEADEESEDGRALGGGGFEQWMVRGPLGERTPPPGSTPPLAPAHTPPLTSLTASPSSPHGTRDK